MGRAVKRMEKSEIAGLAALLFIAVLAFVWVGNQKEDLFIDEYLSYTYANNPDPGGGFTSGTKMQGSEMDEIFAVSEERK